MGNVDGNRVVDFDSSAAVAMVAFVLDGLSATMAAKSVVLLCLTTPLPPQVRQVW